jgi:hypothetical protein
MMMMAKCIMMMAGHPVTTIMKIGIKIVTSGVKILVTTTMTGHPVTTMKNNGLMMILTNRPMMTKPCLCRERNRIECPSC